MAAWEGWFQGFAPLIAPVAMTQAFPHPAPDGFGPVPQLARVLDVGGTPQPCMKNLLWPGVATFAQLPASARPLHGLVRDLPAGVQIIGPAYGENTLFALAEAMDVALGGFTAPKGFA